MRSAGSDNRSYLLILGLIVLFVQWLDYLACYGKEVAHEAPLH